VSDLKPPAPPGSRLSPEAVLRWYLEAGVDEAILETPVDRYRQPARPLAPAAREPGAAAESDAAPPRSGTGEPFPSLSAGSPAPSGSGVAAVENAYAMATAATSLEELRAALDRFDGCPLRRTATRLVFGDGAPDARIVFIGEAPGAEEDRRGIPFVGPSGRLLDKILASIGLDRSRVFISNTLFWRPPGNRSPTSSEVATCMPFVERMLELIAPDLLVALGGPAAMALLGQTESVGRLRGRWFSYQTARMVRPIAATALFHPAYLLRSPAQKRLAWRDLLTIKNRIDAL
jgi:uracil-DNA glycosylase